MLQASRFGLHADMLNRYHYYPTIPTNTAFKGTRIAELNPYINPGE